MIRLCMHSKKDLINSLSNISLHLNAHKTMELTNISFDPATFIPILITSLIVVFLIKTKSKKLPPGPWGLPIVGCFPWIYKKPLDLVIENMHKKYGSIFSFYVGSKLVVFLGTYELMHEAYVVQGDKFSGKPRHSPMEIDGNEIGISISSGPLWKEQRRFVLKEFNELGVGKQKIEPEITEEIRQFMKEIKKYEQEPVYLHDMLRTSTANIISILAFGKRFDYTDEKFIKLKEELNGLTMSLEVFHLYMYFPWLKCIPWMDNLPKARRMKKLKRSLIEFISQIIKNHELNYDTEEHRDLIYAWLDERAQRTERQKSNEFFTIDSLKYNLISIFQAGTQPPHATILTAIGHLVLQPEIQDRCRAEIISVAGKDSPPTTSMKDLLPYTEATLLEVQRFTGTNPYNLVHSVIEDTTLFGYDIPKDTLVFGNLRRSHANPEVWSEPEKFKPERFLSDGKIINRDKVIPFSMGMRMCPGANLSRMEIFLYFTTLLQNFIFSVPDENFTLEHQGDLVRTPKDYLVRITSL